MAFHKIPDDVFTHHIMPAASEAESLRAELASVKEQLSSTISFNFKVRFDLMKLMVKKRCSIVDLYDYGFHVMRRAVVEEAVGKPLFAIDDFRFNVFQDETLYKFRVLKFTENPVPNKTEIQRILDRFGVRVVESVDSNDIYILTAEEHAAEIAKFWQQKNGEWVVPFGYCARKNGNLVMKY